MLPTDRVAAIGMTGSGKSELLAHLWSIYRGQRVLVDVNDAYELGPASLAEENGGAIHAEKVADIDWRARTVHFVPRAQTERVYNDLYAALWARAQETRALCVWLDESYGPTTASKSPRWLRTSVTQGRKYGLFHLAAMQEPVNVAPVLYTQANHVMLFRLAGRPDDLRRLEHRFGMTADELARALERLPEFGYLWSVLGSTDVYEMDPLPRQVLAFTRRHVVIP